MNKTNLNKLSAFVLTEIIKKRLFKYLPDKYFIMVDYYLTHKKFPNLKTPTSFSEKIQWIKLYGDLDKYTNYVDKIKVRKYIERTVGKEHTVPLIGVWNNFDEIDFEKLPQQFVLKATHGSGYVYVCKNKNSLNMQSLKKIITTWIKEDFSKLTREIQYNRCTPKIICENYLEEKNGKLFDYKIFCSNGKPKIIEVVWDRFTNHKGDVYKKLNWKTLDISYINVKRSTQKLSKPKNLKLLLEFAEKLSKPFPFVRVDMYSVDNHIYVGELTLTPGNGLERFYPENIDDWLGKLIDLKKY